MLVLWASTIFRSSIPSVLSHEVADIDDLQSFMFSVSFKNVSAQSKLDRSTLALVTSWSVIGIPLQSYIGTPNGCFPFIVVK